MTIEEALQAAKEQMNQAPDPVNDVLEIDPETRMITVPASEILLGVQHDALAERKYFRCPKIVGDDIDLTKMELYVVFQNAGGTEDRNRDRYHVTDVQAVDDGYIEFSWQLSEKVTSYAGDVQFGVCAIDTDSDGNVVNRWNTGITTGKSMVGLDAGLTDYERESPTDLYTQLITELTQTVSQVTPITVHATLGSGNVVTSDKSFAEITSLIQNGKNILLRLRTEVQSYTLNLSEVSSSQISFRLLSVAGKNVQQMDCVFKGDGSIVYASKTLEIADKQEIVTEVTEAQYTEQSLTDQQQTVARKNIGAAKITYDAATKTLNIISGGVNSGNVQRIMLDGKEVDLANYVQQDGLDYVTAEMYGAVGDGITDDTEALQAALQSEKRVLLNTGKTYLIDSAVIDKVTRVILDGNGATLHAVPHEEVSAIFELRKCKEIVIKNLKVYSEASYASNVTGSNHSVPSGSMSSNRTFLAVTSCGKVRVEDIECNNLYRLFTSWREKDSNGADILNESVIIKQVKSTGWIRSDIYLAYVSNACVEDYETTPAEKCIIGVHVFYLASSDRSKLYTHNVIVHGLKKSGTTGHITGVYHCSGDAVSSKNEDDIVRMDVCAERNQIQDCEYALLVGGFDGTLEVRNCSIINTACAISNLNKGQDYISNVILNGCSISGETVLVESQNDSATSILVDGCQIESTAYSLSGGSLLPEIQIRNSRLKIKAKLFNKSNSNTTVLTGNMIGRTGRESFITGKGTGKYIVSNNQFEAYGGDTQFDTANGTLVVVNNTFNWLDSAPTLCSSNAVHSGNIIMTKNSA